METKFNEVTFRTAVLEEMKENYLAERVLRTWKEDFIDEDTSEVLTIERNEILFQKGVLLDNKLLSELNFYLQSGDVKDVLVSNQARTGYSVNNPASVYCVTIRISGKKKNYYLYSNSVTLAITIITDYLEQEIPGSFSFISVKEIGYSNLIPLDEDNEDDLDNDFYKVEIEIIYEGEDSFEQIYILQANDVESAKELIIRFISLKMKEENRERPFETTIISARKIPCNNIIDYAFVKEYFKNN